MSLTDKSLPSLSAGRINIGNDDAFIVAFGCGGITVRNGLAQMAAHVIGFARSDDLCPWTGCCDVGLINFGHGGWEYDDLWL